MTTEIFTKDLGRCPVIVCAEHTIVVAIVFMKLDRAILRIPVDLGQCAAAAEGSFADLPQLAGQLYSLQRCAIPECILPKNHHAIGQLHSGNVLIVRKGISANGRYRNAIDLSRNRQQVGGQSKNGILWHGLPLANIMIRAGVIIIPGKIKVILVMVDAGIAGRPIGFSVIPIGVAHTGTVRPVPGTVDQMTANPLITERSQPQQDLHGCLLSSGIDRHQIAAIGFTVLSCLSPGQALGAHTVVMSVEHKAIKRGTRGIGLITSDGYRCSVAGVGKATSIRTPVGGRGNRKRYTAHRCQQQTPG